MRLRTLVPSLLPALALGFVLSTSGDAMAKGHGAGSGASAADSAADDATDTDDAAATTPAKLPSDIQTIGLESVDSMFLKVASIDSRLKTMEQKRKKGRNRVSKALGLAKGTSLDDSLTELSTRAQGKVKLAVSGTKLTLKPTDALPDDVATAISNLQRAVDDYQSMANELISLPAEVTALITEAKTMPSKFKDDIGGFKITEIFSRIKQLKKVKQNIDVTLGLPGRVTDLSTGIASDLSAVKSLIPLE